MIPKTTDPLPAVGESEPDRNCPLCPRLAAFRQRWREQQPAWFNAPVPAFGDVNGRLAVVGLAPGLRGANRTGRPFTGDYAGELLYATFLAFGFARGRYEARPDDGLTLTDVRIVNAVRCVPPENKPLPIEITTCRPFLVGALEVMPRLRAVVALGRIAHDSILRAFGRTAASAKFAHGASHALAAAGQPTALRLFDSYHCSRLNTNTGTLTPEMFRAVFADVRAYLDQTS